MTGRPPYEAETFSDVYDKILRRKHKFDSDMWNALSDQTKTFIKRLLEVDPNKRFSSEQALNDSYFQNIFSRN